MTRKAAFLSLIFSFFFTIIIVLSKDASAFNLPDTGQTKCYQSVSPYAEIPCAGTGQDGEYSINPMSYTDNGNGTVTDNNTGLMWQQDKSSTYYTWYKASGTYDSTYNSTSQSVCGSLNLGGHSDWRLPSKKELLSIVDLSISTPEAVISSIFVNTLRVHYWTATTYAYNSNKAWDVDFGSGYSYGDNGGSNNKSYFYYVKCVRGEQVDVGNFHDNNDGTVTDNSTGLMWQKGEPESKMIWQTALDYCESLELPAGSGQRDWRMPNIKELESIKDDTIYEPSNPIDIDKKYFPNAYAFNYWSATTYSYYPAKDGAWVSGFSVVGAYPKDTAVRTRCVRGGQLDISLSSGWNLISLPVQPSDTSINMCLNNVANMYNIVWAYEGEGGEWKMNNPATPIFNTLESMEAGKGYWVYMNTPATLSVSGGATSNSVQLTSGWNLV